MDKQKLRRYKPNKKKIALLDESIKQLKEKMLDVPDVSIKVQKSGDEYPYIQGHMTVKAVEPKKSQDINTRIRAKKLERAKVQAEIEEVDAFIDKIPEGMIEKEILELICKHSMSQQKVADEIGYTQARVSQLINRCLEDL